MKRFFLITACCLSFISTAHAWHDSAKVKTQMDPVCQPAVDQMQQTRPQIDAAIQKNDAMTVGNLVIANYHWMRDFFNKHPQCKPKEVVIKQGNY